MIDILRTMQYLTEKYEHLAEIRITAATDTHMYTAQVKAHPHAKGTINKVFHFEPEITPDAFHEKVVACCRSIDATAREIGATFESPHDPHAG